MTGQVEPVFDVQVLQDVDQFVDEDIDGLERQRF